MGTGTWVWVPVFMAIFFNSLGSGQNVTVTNSPDPIVIQALGSVASLVEEPCAPEKKMEHPVSKLRHQNWGGISQQGLSLLCDRF